MKEILLRENKTGLFDGYIVHIDTGEESKLFEGLLLEDAFKLARSFIKGRGFKFGIEISLGDEE